MINSSIYTIIERKQMDQLIKKLIDTINIYVAHDTGVTLRYAYNVKRRTNVTSHFKETQLLNSREF